MKKTSQVYFAKSGWFVEMNNFDVNILWQTFQVWFCLSFKGSHTFNPLLHLKISLSYFHGIPWPILIYNKINIRIDCTLQIWSSVLTRRALQPMPNNEWKNVHTVIEPSAAGLHFKTKTSVATKIFSTEKKNKNLTQFSWNLWEFIILMSVGKREEGLKVSLMKKKVFASKCIFDDNFFFVFWSDRKSFNCDRYTIATDFMGEGSTCWRWRGGLR